MKKLRASEFMVNIVPEIAQNVDIWPTEKNYSKGMKSVASILMCFQKLWVCFVCFNLLQKFNKNGKTFLNNINQA